MTQKPRNWLEPAKKETPEQALARLRARIDALDDQLIGTLLERIGIIGEVSLLKRAHWPKTCHIRSGREGQMHRRIAARFTGTAFPARTATAIWRLLIGASTHVESPLNISYLASTPAHGWLAREHFSPEARLTPVSKPELATGDNILLLPMPDAAGADWWKQPPTQDGEPLHIFARLPLADEKLPGDGAPCVALAPIQPEPSGDDISYFLIRGAKSLPAITGIATRTLGNAEAQLLVCEAFLAPDDVLLTQLRAQLGGATLTWLGAHPRALAF